MTCGVKTSWRKQVAFLDAHEECGMVHSEVTVINDDDKVIYSRFNEETGRPVPEGHCMLDLLRRNHIEVPTVLERRSCLTVAGSFDEGLLVAQDYYHWYNDGHTWLGNRLFTRTARYLSMEKR